MFGSDRERFLRTIAQNDGVYRGTLPNVKGPTLVLEGGAFTCEQSSPV